jgi:hypothetical protein
MPDYKDLYFHMMHETERAIRILEEAQAACEERYLSDPGPSLRILPQAPAADGEDTKG